MAQLTAERDELNRLGLALQANFATLQAQNAHLQSQLAAVPAAPTVPPMVRKSALKCPPPTVFAGAVGTSVEEWLRLVTRFIDFNPTEFGSEAIKIQWAELYLGIDAAHWLKGLRAELATEGRTIPTFDDLAAELRSRYQPLNASVSARQRLDKLTQTGSVSAYNSIFLKIVTEIPDMDGGSRLHHYTKGLKQTAQFEVVRQGSKTVHQAMGVAVTTEAYSTSTNQGANRYQRGGGGAAPSTAMDLSNINGDVVLEDVPETAITGASISAMEQKMEQLLAMFNSNNKAKKDHKTTRSASSSSSSGGTRVANVSREDYQKCRDHSACLKCKKDDHVAKDCTNSFAPVPSNW